MERTALLLVVSAAVAWGTVPGGVSLRVDDETAPPGGVAQIRLELTEPKPITTGGVRMRLDAAMFASVLGVAAFSSTGDVHGVALVEDDHLRVTLSSPRGTYGTGSEYPILVITVAVSPEARVGQSVVIGPDNLEVNWQDVFGGDYAIELKPGTFTVGGSVAIGNVVPGGGTIPAGSTFAVNGMWFAPGARVQVESVEIDTERVVSSSRIEVTAKLPFRMDGSRVRVRNPDDSSDTYYAYHRGVPLKVSQRALLAHADPLFPFDEYQDAILPLVVEGSGAPEGYYTGLALENLSAPDATVQVSLVDALGRQAGVSSVTLPFGMRLIQSLAEFVPGGDSVPFGGFVRIASTAPVRALGLVCNEAGQAVAPLRLVSNLSVQSELAVVNGASFQAGAPVAPGALVSAYGDFAVVVTGQTQTIPWPEAINAVLAIVCGVVARLHYVSSTQVNLLVPQVLSTASAPIRVERDGSVVGEGTVMLRSTAPGLFVRDFLDAELTGSVLNQDSGANEPARPALRGEALQIFASGQGTELSAPAADGSAPSQETRTTLVPEVFLGAIRAEVLFSGLSPQFPGVWQINARVPSETSVAGQVPLFVTIDGAPSNVVSVWVAP